MAEQESRGEDQLAEHTDDPAAAAWLLVLDVLEMAVTAAEKTLNDPLGPLSAPLHQPESALPVQRWSPPVLSGPLPPEARRRAMALSAAQERVAKRLEAAKQDVSRQLHALSTVPSLSSPSRAVYLDVQG
ncbi:hypothetical protein AB4Y86_13280 [Arthrobacter sp. 2YAF22_2]|uniref:hypothetical protein n=1 Tax=Arthrobacter sp. 2YAF22_2 TaxID=3233029 RepID=UPI003F8E8E1D